MLDQVFEMMIIGRLPNCIDQYENIKVDVGATPQFGPMTGLLNPAMKKNQLGRSANQRVYVCGIDHEDTMWVSQYVNGDLIQIFRGFENSNARKPILLQK